MTNERGQRHGPNQWDHAVAAEPKAVHPVGQPISASTNAGFSVRRGSELSLSGEAFRIIAYGRTRWALQQLRCAVAKGCTPIDNPAPRWSAYVFNLRELGVDIETITEPHYGDFAGHNARYVLRCGGSIFAARLKSILARTVLTWDDGRTLKPESLTLTPSVRALLVAFSDTMEAAQAPRGALSHITGTASKVAEQAARIAGMLSLWADLDAHEVQPNVISEAITLAQFYLAVSTDQPESCSTPPSAMRAIPVTGLAMARVQDCAPEW